MAIKRNLIFHIYPVRHIGTWQRCLDRLLPRLKQFDGRRLITVTHDDNTDPPAAVRDYVGNQAEVYPVENERHLQEVSAWNTSWSKLNLSDTNAATFYGHAKGVTRNFRPGAMVHLWTDIMMETLLDHPALIEDMMMRFPVAGSLKKYGEWFPNVNCPWHYTGTFFWVRNTAAQVYGNIAPTWWGTEAWPGSNFDADSGGVVFYEDKRRNFDMYNCDYVTSKVLPALRKWRQNVL